MKFNIICADFPWSFNDTLKMSDVARGADSNYNVMPIKDLKDLKINHLSDNKCLLALWILSSLLQEGLDIAKVNGFKHKQTYIWRRQRSGYVCIEDQSVMTFGEDVRVSIDKLLNLNNAQEIELLSLISNYTSNKSVDLIKND